MIMAFFPSNMSLLFFSLMGILCSSHAKTFMVGGGDGWTLHPLENYSHWAKRHRFQINDTLVFKYKKTHDSVLIVSEEDFLTCNKDNPIKSLDDGNSKFRLTKSGPFFFISGYDQNCEMAQKLIVIVISPNHHNITHTSPSPTTPSAHGPPSPPPSLAPTTENPLRRITPSSHSPSPSWTPSGPPSYSPSPSPASKNPSQSHEPPTNSPLTSAVAVTPTYSPSIEPPSHFPFPAAKTPTHTPSSSPTVEAALTPPPLIELAPHSPSPSPLSRHSPSPMPPQTESPKISIGAPKPELQHHHHAPTPESYSPAFPPHHVPAPTVAHPGAGSDLGGSC